jgi:lipoprotein-releasing system permease protein
VVTTAIAVSFLVVIIAVAVSDGFRYEIRRGLSQIAGDIQLTVADENYVDESSPVQVNQSYIPYIKDLQCVQSVEPVIYRAGIVQHTGEIYGVIVKGVEHVEGIEAKDSIGLGVSVPVSLAEKAGLKKGDKLPTYFIGEKVKVRQFNVAHIYEPLVRTDDRYLVYADIGDMRKLNGWNDEQTSMFEVTLEDEYKDEESMMAASDQISDVIFEYCSDGDDFLRAVSSVQRFPRIFEWISLIDFNVVFVLILMVVVAGVNMITGLLIMLFENISTIGLLKSLGMRNVQIINVYLTRAAGTVFKGMLIGNLLAIAFCLVQNATHFIPLDPVNYYVSYIPVHIDLMSVLCVDFVAFVVIMLLLLLPSLFVLRVDPAKTLKKD